MVNLSDANQTTPSPDAENLTEVANNVGPLPPEPDASMDEYQELQRELLITTIAFTVVAFFCIWGFYSLNMALNYSIGACTGVVYLRMLARDVEQLGRQKANLSKSRLAVFIGVMIVATQWQQLKVLPIFLGFLSYKVALIFYTIRSALLYRR